MRIFLALLLIYQALLMPISETLQSLGILLHILLEF
jgi:hypothetical protein